jgi:hypothetical protein
MTFQPAYFNQTELRHKLQNLFAGTSWIDWTGGEDLWFLLSALRGPDSQDNTQDDNLKIRTTWRLRDAIAPKFFIHSPERQNRPLPDKPDTGEDRFIFQRRIRAMLQQEFPESQDHFIRHYADAC